MSIVLWAIAALVGGGLVIFLGTRAAGRSSEGPPLDEPLPDTPLQRLARRGLWSGAALTAALVGYVLYFGPERVQDEDPLRIGFTLLLVVILALFAGIAVRVTAWTRREDGTLDERDRTILASSQGLRSSAILLTFAVWVIGLQERYWDAGAVPVYYLHLVFWSCLVVSLLAFPVGILAGYRRS
jgi:hypothetical protein